MQVAIHVTTKAKYIQSSLFCMPVIRQCTTDLDWFVAKHAYIHTYIKLV